MRAHFLLGFITPSSRDSPLRVRPSISISAAMKLSRPPRKILNLLVQFRMVAQPGAQRLSRSRILARRLTQLVSRVKDPHHSKHSHVAHQLCRDSLAWVRQLVLVVVPLRDSHPHEALHLVRVSHLTLLYPAATLLRHKGMDQDHVRPRQEACLRKAPLVVALLRNNSLTRLHPLVSLRLKAPLQGGSDRRSFVVLLSTDLIPRLNVCFLTFTSQFSSSYSPSRSNLFDRLVRSHLVIFFFCSLSHRVSRTLFPFQIISIASD